ncbi:GAF domain-containing protein [Pseudonocardia adelaidensis]
MTMTNAWVAPALRRLGGLLAGAVLAVAWFAARARRDEHETARLSQEQAGQRRVATLVAGGARPREVFAAVSDEIARLLAPDLTTLVRFEADGSAGFLAGGGWRGGEMRVGRSIPVPPSLAPLRDGAVVRIDDLRRHPDMAETVEKQGLLGVVACPVFVEGRVWGAFGVGSRAGALPASTERRLVDFMELIGAAIANAESRAQVGRLLDEQAALRRVATVVARGAPAQEVFAAAADEVAAVLRADVACLIRADVPTMVAASGWDDAPIGVVLDRYPQLRTAFELGEPYRTDDLSLVPHEAEVLAGSGVRGLVATPVTVEGRFWGVLVAGSRSGPPPVGAEHRLVQFTELVGTAIANTESRSEILRLLAEQGALQRVATLVATGASSLEVSRAVAGEVRGLLGVADAGVCRFEPDGTAVLLVGIGDTIAQWPPGTRFAVDDMYSVSEVWRTGSSARFDAERWQQDIGAVGAQLRRLGVQSVVAGPVTVEGRLWGAVIAWSSGTSLPDDTEERMARFTDLVAMAIGNAENQAKLAASRARIVTASDEARRRIERDLHDGAQQRIVSLGLELRLAQAGVPDELPEVRAGLARVADGLADVLDELRETARGIHPAMLSEGGLQPALRTLARRAPVPVELDVATDARFPEPVEVAAYYVVSESLTNAAKHARASHVAVAVSARDGDLRLSVRDDGVGGADPQGGSGLIGLRDRVEALGGTIEVASPRGGGTSVVVTLPAADGQDRITSSRGR